MDQNQYSILDSKARSWSIPFFSRNDEVAQRNFAAVVNDERSDVARYPADYTLFRVGNFNTHTGVVTPEDQTNLGNGLMFTTPEWRPGNGAPTPNELLDQVVSKFEMTNGGPRRVAGVSRAKE